MKQLIYILFMLLISCKALADSTEEMRLRTKADEAFSYCKKNNMDTTFCILIDMKVHSGKYRFFVWDFSKKNVADHSLCCHGMGVGSAEETPVFSNKSGSYCSSLGKYKIGVRSYSNWGINVHYKLHGLESANSNAFKRVVVLHSYTPVSETEIYPTYLPMGWSLGCPVISNNIMRILDKKISIAKRPVLLWIYY